jgi:hypothetical protein
VQGGAKETGVAEPVAVQGDEETGVAEPWV